MESAVGKGLFDFGFRDGKAGEAISFLSGLALMFFSLSGVWMYVRMWRERARAKEAKTCSAEATQSIVESQSQELPERSEQRGHEFAQLSAPLTAPHGTEKRGR